MSSHADHAKRLSILLEYGVPVGLEAVQWADSQIASMDSPSQVLLELSTTPPEHTADILSHLHILARGGNFWSALRAAMPRMHQHLVSHPGDAERIASKLFQAVVTSESVPSDFQFAYHFDDAFGLARNRVFGDIESVRTEFIEELAPFARHS